MSANSTAANAKVLVIDDDKDLRYSLRRALAGLGHTVIEADSGETGVVAAKREQPDVILLDNRMGGMTGIETLQMLRGAQPQAMVILMTAFGTTQTAIEAMKFGAYDYVMKPFDQAKLITLVDKALSARRDLANAVKSTRTLVNPADYKEGIVGSSEPMQEVLKSIGQVAASDATVLITGESGTGKELAARAIHDSSPRKDKPFVAVDCSSLAETLLESELFGHIKGSFTGAVQTKTGLFKVADGGTLFLDEVSNISISTQAKLLRALQERKITPIGGTQPVSIDIHLVAATNKNLKTMVHEGTFREDLFFRLNIIPIELPPLRDRTKDIPILIRHFLKKYTHEIGKEIRGVAPDVLSFLEHYAYPGNVRELENIIERAVVLAEGDVIRNEDLELWDSTGKDSNSAECLIERIPMNAEELKEMKRHIRDHAIESLESLFVRNALERNGWNVTRAAEETGILRPNFQGMMKKLGISVKGEH